MSNVAENTKHRGADVAATIVGTRAEESNEGEIEEFPSTQRHDTRILVGGTELKVVEHIEVLQEGTSVGEELCCAMALDVKSMRMRGSFRVFNSQINVETISRDFLVSLILVEQELPKGGEI